MVSDGDEKSIYSSNIVEGKETPVVLIYHNILGRKFRVVMVAKVNL